MPSYWWKCQGCGETEEFSAVTQSKGIAHYIWDILIPTQWDQSHLLLPCSKCNSLNLRITYEFPRKDRVELTLIHAVGLGPFDDIYVPMMWETAPDSSTDDEHWIDFKYINGRSVFGLNKAAVFTRADIHALFAKFGEVSGQCEFP